MNIFYSARTSPMATALGDCSGIMAGEALACFLNNHFNSQVNPALVSMERIGGRNLLCAVDFLVATERDFRLNTEKDWRKRGAVKFSTEYLLAHRSGTGAFNNLSKVGSFFRKLANAGIPRVYA